MKIYISFLMVFFLLSVASPAMEEVPLDDPLDNTDLSRHIQTSIMLQRESYQQPKTSRSSLVPENDNDDDDDITDFLPKDNIYHVPDAKDDCGFLCGRCLFFHYPGKHPNHDCVQVDRRCVQCGDCFTAVGLNFSALMSHICIGGGFTFSGMLPLVISSSITGFWLLRNIPGFITCAMEAPCSQNYLDQDFKDSYDRGQLCLPEDACSCTSLIGHTYVRPRVKSNHIDGIECSLYNKLCCLFCCSPCCCDTVGVRSE